MFSLVLLWKFVSLSVDCFHLELRAPYFCPLLIARGGRLERVICTSFQRRHFAICDW